MDELDARLIGLLRHDGRRSISDLALHLGVTRTTIRARMSRLEREGEIVGYSVILRTDRTDHEVRGIMMIEIQGPVTDKVIRNLSGMAEVSAIHTTSGRWDLIAELGTSTLPDLDAVLRRIRLIPGIANSETSLLLATPRSTKVRT